MQEQWQTLYKSSSNFQFLSELNTSVFTSNIPFLAIRKKKKLVNPIECIRRIFQLKENEVKEGN